MTTPVDTTVKTKTVKRKPAVKRDFNALGKFFAKVRIDLGITTSQWSTLLNTSSLTITNIERSNGKMTFEFATKVAKLIEEKAPQYVGEFAGIVAKELGVLVIPSTASEINIHQAYNVLHGKLLPYDGTDE